MATPSGRELSEIGQTKTLETDPSIEGLSELTLQEAANGNQEQQLTVGKHYLSLAESEISTEENGKLAVDWLIKSSKQGNEEATTLLSRCLQNKTGLREEILPEITWCIKTTAVEKKVRHSARELFWQINQSRKSALTKDEYVEAIKTFANSKLEKSMLMAAAKKLGDDISETRFVKAVSKQIQGKIIPTSEEAAEKEAGFESSGALQKLRKYPRETIMMAVNQGLEVASKEGTSWVLSLVPINQIQIMLLLFAYNFLSPGFIFLVVPLFVFYISILCMLVSTLQMFYGKKKLSNVTTWAKLMSEHNVAIDVDSAQSQFMWNSLTPYLVFFSSLFFTVASFSLAEKSYIPCSELCVLAGGFAFLTFIGLSDSYDFLLIISVLCSFFAALPTFMLGFPYIPVVTWLISFITSPIFYIEVSSMFRINIGLPSLSYIIVPLFFARMAMKKSWQGTYRILVPHLVCYFWWNFMSTLFPFTTWFGLVRATVGYALTPVLLPLMIAGGLIYGFYTVLIAMKSDIVGKILVTLFLLAIPVCLTKSKQIFGPKFELRYGFAKKFIMVSLAVVSIIPLVFIRLPSGKVKTLPPLTWEEYRQHCLPISVPNLAGMQMKCAHLHSVKVNWSGKVSTIKISKVENSVDKFLGGLPDFFSDYLRCVYGEKYLDCAAEGLTEMEIDTCLLMKTQKHKCHVKEHDVYTFQVALLLADEQGNPSIPVNIVAEHKFKETLLALEQDDEITVTAVLKEGLGTAAPQLSLRQLNCTSRELTIMQVIDDDFEGFYEKKVNEMTMVAFHFVWYPLLEFTP